MLKKIGDLEKMVDRFCNGELPSKDLNCHIIVAAIMKEFPKRSRASISKQTK
jgi:hypothetical protein